MGVCVYCECETGDEHDEHEACVERSMERALVDAAAEANARIASCHEVVACPKCGAPVGVRCGRVGTIAQRTGRRPLKHPHVERWTLVQPAR